MPTCRSDFGFEINLFWRFYLCNHLGPIQFIKNWPFRRDNCSSLSHCGNYTLNALARFNGRPLDSLDVVISEHNYAKMPWTYKSALGKWIWNRRLRETTKKPVCSIIIRIKNHLFFLNKDNRLECRGRSLLNRELKLIHHFGHRKLIARMIPSKQTEGSYLSDTLFSIDGVHDLKPKRKKKIIYELIGTHATI